MKQEGTQQAITPGECRECRCFCDKLVEPAHCIEIECRNIYSYRDEVNQRLYVGCLEKVFKVEIDLELMNELERSKIGFGGIKLAAPTLKQCAFFVESTFIGAGEEFNCANMSFFDCASSDRYCYKVTETGSDIASTH